MYDIKDERGVPVSGGIPPIVVFAVVAAIILACVIAGMVLSTAHYGHIWPSSKSVNVPL
jgi:hypothetical protein